MTIRYTIPQQTGGMFDLAFDDDGRLTVLRHPDDPHRMNWVKGRDDDHHWGDVICAARFGRTKPAPLDVTVARTLTESGLRETITFTNPDSHDLYLQDGMLGIVLTFPDYYEDADVTLTQCCHTHLWCEGSSACIQAKRMGGGPCNLGLALTRGELAGYSVQRNFEHLSNDRGAFVVHPADMILHPGESSVLEWELFWYDDDADFRAHIARVPGFVSFETDRYVAFKGEGVHLRAEWSGADGDSGARRLHVTENGIAIPFRHTTGADGANDGDGTQKVDTHEIVDVTVPADRCGERRYCVDVNGRKSVAVVDVLPTLDDLASRRCRFIVERQQCHDTNSHLDGAYLVYDNDRQTQYYGHWNDHNGGRERVGMGAMIARYLQRHSDDDLQRSLSRYLDYVLRELVDETTGEVYNDMPRDNSYRRLYNYPWMATLFMEAYRVYADPVWLDRMIACLRRYYQEGGERFYAIGIPVYESITLLRETGRERQADELLSLYRRHGDRLAANGRHYPAHEVNYEQSIVGPAASVLTELFRLTGEHRYRDEAAEQLELLSLFDGHQPHYRLNEVALRHWDDYWFGRMQLFGDTFPHYWSAITGDVFAQAGDIDAGYAARARANLRAVLTLIHDDGSATCAHVFPRTVNGVRAACDDPWANDQDWALYYALKHEDVVTGRA